ncbi:iron-containing redox enzyme family protein [Varunaivibrio sulfuroxidans]|uniref:Heme oxygenase-like protein n=1 Tax=Varunaivibrio sulfuroxidans TaxID=1773489 RepID=A0A4R3J9E3_9PROT|nr:iron-containing redox enzyme family protein [Varunaivibrio sulfuroxidans]TCS62104.1 heme oxygenase-like protein [Varunaivibrio sulfuroxidans]WES30537.1 iron-containing redox enzyme family protein [Varunaivibrio sulfuroxidans]
MQTELYSTFMTVYRADDISVVLDTPEKNEVFFTAIERVVHKAFLLNDDAALLSVHRILFEIYFTTIARPSPEISVNQNHPVIARVRHMIEQRWLVSLREKLGSELRRAVHGDDADFIHWVAQLAKDAKLEEHPLFDYLGSNESSLEDFYTFFKFEGLVASTFVDLVALSVVGNGGSALMETASNLFDELGSGDPKQKHTNLYRQLVRLFESNEAQLSDMDIVELSTRLFDWRGYAGFNLFMCFATNRSQYFENIGCLGFAELVDPVVQNLIVSLSLGKGIRAENLNYYSDHGALDVEHGEGWLSNVIAPAVTAYPNIKEKIAFGVLCRLDTSRRYFDSIYERVAGVTPAVLDRAVSGQ